MVRLVGTPEWSYALVQSYAEKQGTESCCKLGGTPLINGNNVGYKQGNQLLGTELSCLIFDDADGFDADSITAASGALRGGGLFFLLLSQHNNLMYQWLENALVDQITLSENHPLPELPFKGKSQDSETDYPEQSHAVSLVEQVSNGHRKRPLVLTADRGRGKSSALGMAAAKLMMQKRLKIVVTAPARRAVQPIFEHAIRELNSATDARSNHIEFEGSSLEYIAPDVVIDTLPECDLIMVDEASAIPVPLLIQMAERYSRIVLSTTIHGYEGCGRGFTLKFFKWLDAHRPDWKKWHLNQPIRWSENDPLERWIFDTFLLDAESRVLPAEVDITCLELKQITKRDLVNSVQLFRDIFALLVNAHYQTTPNDMVQLLNDEEVELFIVSSSNYVFGAMVVKSEGGLDNRLITDIMTGSRRPKGHLAPSLLISHLGEESPAQSLSLRIMRIVVSPEHQSKQLGSLMLTKLNSQVENRYDFLSTSYGVSKELLRFWKANQFSPMRLGVSRDQASGTYSLLMVMPLKRLTWFNNAKKRFHKDFVTLLPETYRELPIDIVIGLLRGYPAETGDTCRHSLLLIKNYALGGSCYESIVYSATQVLLQQISRNDIHPILVSKLLQRKTWSEIAVIYHLTGRKESERLFRDSLQALV